MRRITRLTGLVCTACAACLSALLLFVPIEARSEMPEQPDTPLVTVAEIGNNWVKIEGLTKLRETNATIQELLADKAQYELDPSGFDPDNPSHLAQARDLGDYVCRLNDRRGVLLSQITESRNGFGLPHYYYLVACALP